MSFTYDPLTDAGNQIRTAVLQPGAYDDDLRIRFETLDLRDGSRDIEPEYDALSYAWGSYGQVSRVFIGESNTQTISITRNLDEALRHLRNENVARRLWIDALCIDQGSDFEKGKQVAAMGRVFQRADSVIVWIGPAQDDSDTAIDQIRWISERIIVDPNTRRMEPSNICVGEEERNLANKRETMPFGNGELEPILHVLQRPYFSRTWVRQEVGCAKNAILHCGSQTLPWNAFVKCLTFFYYKPYYSDSVRAEYLESWRNIRKKVYSFRDAIKGSYFFSTVRYDLGATYCQDPRDKIYAALAMLAELDSLLGIKPDYTKKVEDVYTDVARRVILDHVSLDILDSCALAARALNIPSWVPDWSIALPDKGRARIIWSACAWISSHISASDDKSITVSGLSVAPTVTVFDGAIQDPREPGAIEYSLQMIRKFKSQPPDLAKHCNGSYTWTEIVCMALLNCSMNDKYYPPRTDLFNLSHYVEALNLIWSDNKGWWDYDSATQNYLNVFMGDCVASFEGLWFFEASNGVVGVAPDVREGDVICVLLGFRSPVLLRPMSKNSANQSYEVVGTCCVPGLMHGELFYKTNLPRRFKPVFNAQPRQTIDFTAVALLDTESGELALDPAQILEDCGIKVEKYQNQPHILEVSAETLKAAGIILEDFKLV